MQYTEVRKRMKRRWTAQEVAIVQSGMPIKKMMKILGRSYYSIRDKQRALQKSDYVGIYAPEFIPYEEKVARIENLALKLGIRLGGDE